MSSDEDHAQEGHRRDAELFRVIVESATEYAIFATDRDGRIVSWNSGAGRTLGYSEAEAVGQHASIFFTPEDIERGKPLGEMREALRAGRALDQRWHVRKGGGRFWADGLLMPLRDGAGEPRGFVKILRDRTAEKRADDALQESRDLYRAIAANLPNGSVFLVDRGLRYLLADGQALREVGLAPADFEGKGLREALPPGLADRFEADYRAILAGEDFQAEHECFGRSYSSHGVPLRDAGGTVYAALVVSYDITERERLYRQVHDERGRLAEVFQRSPSFLAVLRGPEHVFELANERYYGLVGHREIVGRPVREALPEVEGQGFFELLDRVYRTGEPFLGMDMRLMVRAHPGRPLEERFVDFVYQPVRDPDGRVSSILAHGVDNTERKRAEEQLRESEGRYRALFTSIDEGFCVIEMIFDEDGMPSDYRFLEVNPAFERHTGLRDAVGKRIRELTPDLEDHWFRAYGRVAEAGEPVRFENEAKGLGGRWFDVYAFRLGEPERRRVAVLFTDISERKRLEASLRHRVRDLADADRRKNEFLAMLAHELRNPLSGIAGAIRLARGPGLGEQISYAHEVIERQAGNLARLIDDLLDVSRITQGKVELKREVVDVPGVITRAAESVGHLIERRRHELMIQVTGGSMHVDADPTRLEQVVANLLTNAAKYTGEGGLITVSARKRRGQVVISVKDTGVGISPEMLPKVFDLFTQVDRTLARSEGGLGIGLTLVKQLVEMHGGTIEAASEPGKGSEFTVRLPLVGKAPDRAAPGARPVVSGRGKKILIVDDNADTARLTGKILQMLDFAVEIAHDGHTAIEAARLDRPEVVLLDIGLPGMNGFEVARQLRQEACCRDTLIIGVSGYGDDEARERAREAGFDHHLVKPVDIDSLLPLLVLPDD